MARPTMPAGTHGKIRFQRAPGSAAWRARTQVRDWDGRTRPVERTGRTQALAERRLKLAIRDRVRADAPDDITPDTKIETLAEAWFDRLNLAATTMEQYRRIMDKNVLPGLGQLRVRELTISRADRFQALMRERHGASTAKMTRSVLSGICGLACRHNAMPSNPIREVATIPSTPKPATALTLEQARQVRAYLTYDDIAVRRDLPDFVDIMIATSLRIGECAAIHWTDVDLETGTLAVRGNVVRLKGKGLMVKRTESSKLKHRMLRLPSWAVDMLRRRRGMMDGNGPVFPAQEGGLRDPSNTQGDLREAFDFIGMPGLTSHIFRKTVATLMEDKGRTPRNISDQLGHAQTAMTQNKYLGRALTDTGAAEALELLSWD